jgi:transketolase
MKQASTRRAVTEGLLDVIEHDPTLVLVSSDSTLVIKAQDFMEKYPEHVMELGISEQAAMAASAGIAACGLKPVYVSYAVFATQRACEQLRNTVAYTGLDVKIVGANGGMGAGEREGVTHQGLEDIGIVRAIPGTTVLSPADAGQVRKAVSAMMSIKGPVYLRIGSGRDPVFWDDGTPFEPGKCREFFNSGDDLVIFSHGFVLPIVKEACAELSESGIKVKAVEVATIKPLNGEALLPYLQNSKAAVVVEDHNVIGGLGSAVSEFASSVCPRKVIRIGLDDRFSESGTPDELYEKYGITRNNIVIKAIDALKNTLE